MSKVITFYAPIGGVGKTTMAAMYAMKLAQRGYKVLLVDFALFGSLDFIFRKKNFEGAIKPVESVENLFIKYAGTPVTMDKITGDMVVDMMVSLEDERYDYVVFDTASDLSDRNMSVLEQADEIFLLMTQDISNIWRASSFLDVCRSLYIDQDKIKVVMNRFRKDIRFNLEEIEEVLKLKCIAKVPYYKGYLMDLMNAQSVTEVSKKKATLKGIHKAVDKLIEGDGNEDRRQHKAQERRKIFGKAKLRPEKESIG